MTNPIDVMPAAEEHAPYYSKYTGATADALRAANLTSVHALLQQQMPALRALVKEVTPDAATRGYAPGKWSLLESLLHVADAERVFSYRMLRIARGDKTALPGFEQDDWVPNSGANRRSLADILTELESIRSATLALVGSIDADAAVRVGTASGNPVSVRALAWITAGHFAHHLELTRTKYLGAA